VKAVLLLAVAAVIFVVLYCDNTVGCCSSYVCCAVPWQHSSTTELMDGTLLVVGEQVGIGKFW